MPQCGKWLTKPCTCCLLQASRIFFLAGTLDASGSPVLMLAYDKEPFIRLYEVPTFVNRGVLTPVSMQRHVAEPKLCFCVSSAR